MRSQSLLAVLATSFVGQVAAQDAKVNHDNPPGVIVKATLPDKAFSPVSLPQGGNAKGEITAMSAPDGKGVLFKVKFSNLPKDSFPFTYHLHVDPVPSDGNCTKTLAHLDPFARGEATDCDASKLASCQVGDLSGKYGKVTKDPYEAEYLDEYVSLKEGLGAYFGNRSFVLHFSNKTRISCANFEVKHGPPGGGHGEDDQCDHEEGAASGTGSLPAPTKEPVPFVGGAAASSASMLGIFAAIMFAL